MVGSFMKQLPAAIFQGRGPAFAADICPGCPIGCQLGEKPLAKGFDLFHRTRIVQKQDTDPVFEYFQRFHPVLSGQIVLCQGSTKRVALGGVRKPGGYNNAFPTGTFAKGGGVTIETAVGNAAGDFHTLLLGELFQSRSDHRENLHF